MCSNGMALLDVIWVAEQTNNERSQNSFSRNEFWEWQAMTIVCHFFWPRGKHYKTMVMQNHQAGEKQEF